MKLIYLLSSILILSARLNTIEGITITHVILSANSDPTYLDFWPLAAQLWKQRMHINPVLVLVAPKNTRVDRSVGRVITIEPQRDIPLWLQAQLVRLIVPALFPNYTFIISDIDMFPISQRMFFNTVKTVPADHLVVYRSNAYPANQKRFAMCYIAGKGSTFKEIFAINTLDDINERIKQWARLDNTWGADERIAYKTITQWHYQTNRVTFLQIPFGSSHRIDRINWTWSTTKLRNGYYYDAHLPRPLFGYRQEIMELYNHLLNTP